jgi:hypothetical protein
MSPPEQEMIEKDMVIDDDFDHVHQWGAGDARGSLD